MSNNGLPDSFVTSVESKKITQQEFFNFDYKASCRVATTGSITLSGTQIIDVVSVVADDRVLVKNQADGAANGIYVCASGNWKRSTDFDVNSGVTSGSFIHISEGTENGDKSFVLTTNDPIDLGTTALTFVELTANVADKSITYAKIQDVDANSVLVRNANSSGRISPQALATTQILIGNGDGFTAASLSGDVTMTNAGDVTIENDKVTYAKMQDTSNPGSDGIVLGRLNGEGAGLITELTFAQVCFLKGTKITLPNHEQKNIEDLKLGDKILTYHIKGLSNLKKNDKMKVMNWSQNSMEGSLKNSKVRNIWVNPADQYLIINDKLKLTNKHIIHIKRDNEFKFLPAEDTRIGDQLFTDREHYEEIHTIEQKNEKTEVYNIEVKRNKTYFAENYLVHHFCETCSGFSERI